MNVCGGCGSVMWETGSPIWEEYCPNQQCTYQRDRFLAQARANMAETEKRKRLERAAPELLDRLENLVIGIGMGWDLDGLVDAAKEAIAKATGETS